VQGAITRLPLSHTIVKFNNNFTSFECKKRWFDTEERRKVKETDQGTQLPFVQGSTAEENKGSHRTTQRQMVRATHQSNPLCMGLSILQVLVDAICHLILFVPVVSLQKPS
jgi:hypothetical protein